MKEKIRVLLADDHQIMMDGIQSLISPESDIEVVGMVNNGRDAIQHANILKPDILLMDLDMPIMNGMVAGKKLKQERPEVKIIILSLHAEKSVIQNMIENGIDGYLIKSADSSEVIQAIRSVASGKKYFSAETTLALSRNRVETPNTGFSPALQQQLSLLSNRETEILKAIADGLTNKEIADKLILSPRTIDAHRANIMKKLEINKVTGLVKFAIKSGLIS